MQINKLNLVENKNKLIYYFAMNLKNIKLNQVKKLGILRIDRPKEKNSLDIGTSKEILEALKKFENDKKINSVLITGGSKIFSSGADIHELDKLDSKKAIEKGLFNYFDKIKEIKIPIISAIEGYALGGGLELALITDLILASENAKFGQPEIKLGLIPGIGGTQRLKEYVGKYHAAFLCMSGETISAEEAYKFGIVSKIFKQENFNDQVIKFAEKVSQSPRSNLIEIKKLLNFNTNIEEGLKLERQSFYRMLDNKNKIIGIKSFLDKKEAKWEE